MQPDWSNQIITIYLIGQFKPVKWYDIISLVKWYHITSRVSFLFTALSHWYPHIICNKSLFAICLALKRINTYFGDKYVRHSNIILKKTQTIPSWTNPVPAATMTVYLRYFTIMTISKQSRVSLQQLLGIELSGVPNKKKYIHRLNQSPFNHRRGNFACFNRNEILSELWPIVSDILTEQQTWSFASNRLASYCS